MFTIYFTIIYVAVNRYRTAFLCSKIFLTFWWSAYVY